MSRSLPLQLAAHVEALSRCCLCEHEDPAVRPILSEATAPRIILVGQAPGKSEIRNRRPFAGRAGKTLFRWLARAGLEEDEARQRVYIAAVTRCYPGPSPSGRGDRVPTPWEQALCRRWLDAELQVIQPALIIPVGRLAIDIFLGDRPLADVIGHAHRLRHVGGETIAVPLPHPSGASSWIHAPGHAALLDRALETLRTLFVQILEGTPI